MYYNKHSISTYQTFRQNMCKLVKKPLLISLKAFNLGYIEYPSHMCLAEYLHLVGLRYCIPRECYEARMPDSQVTLINKSLSTFSFYTYKPRFSINFKKKYKFSIIYQIALTISYVNTLNGIINL